MDDCLEGAIAVPCQHAYMAELLPAPAMISSLLSALASPTATSRGVDIRTKRKLDR